ncbi:MAG TPA: hypothetical protein VFP72_15285, partial [Kineosporiaceae bacterium]|nr:hypothetical protein [Kineosporiaceae bacterium]
MPAFVLALLVVISALGISALPASAATGAQPSAWNSTAAISPGVVSTVAGSGSGGVTDGTGTTASFANAQAVSITSGYAYVYDTSRIRRVTLSSGAVTTVAGQTYQGCSDASTGLSASVGSVSQGMVNDGVYLYWVDGLCGSVRRMSLSTTAVSTLASAGTGVTFRSLTVGPDGAVYVGTTAGTILRVDTSTAATTTVLSALPSNVGLGSSFSITAMAADSTSLWVIGVGRCTGGSPCGAVFQVDPSTGVASVVSSTVPATSTSQPAVYSGPLVSAGSYLYAVSNNYTDGTPGAVLRIRKSDGAWTRIAGSDAAGYLDGTGAQAWFTGIGGLDTDGTNLWVGDTNRVRKISVGTALASDQPSGWNTTATLAPGVVSTLAGSGTYAVTDGTGTSASFANATSLSVAGAFAYVYDNGKYIRKVNLSTGVVTTVAGGGGSCSDTTTPSSAAITNASAFVNDGSFLYWLDGLCGSVRRMSLATNAVSTLTRAPSGQTLRALTVGPAGFVYAGTTTGTIIKVDPVSRAVTTLATTLPTNIGMGSSYSITALTADSTSLWLIGLGMCGSSGPCGAVFQVNPSTGAVTAVSSTVPTTASSEPALYSGPLVSAGDYLYAVASSSVKPATAAVLRIRKSDGAWTRIAGSDASGYIDGIGSQAWFNGIGGLDSDGTNLWAADLNRIRKISPATPLGNTQPPGWTTTTALSSVVATSLAGNGTYGTADGTGTAASFYWVSRLTVAGGYAYVYDNYVIRKIALSTGAVTTVAGADPRGSCTDSNVPTSAKIPQASALINDGTYLYWLDNCGSGAPVRRMSLATNAVSTLVDPISGVTFRSLTVGPDGGIYTGTNIGSVLRIDPISRAVTTVTSSLPNVGLGTVAVNSMTADATSLWAVATGTCATGGGQCEAIFSVDPTTGTATVLAGS